MAKVAFLFPGQGAQHLGMGVGLSAKYPAARALFDQAREILGFDLLEICEKGPQEQLDSTVISQPALFVASLAALESLKIEQPALVESCVASAGLSLGEYTALVFAGAMTFEEGLKVVAVRGRAMQAAADATPSGMVSALLLEPAQVEQVVAESQDAGKIWIANYLCPGNTVLSGEKAACAKAAERIEAAGGRPIPLAVAGAFHTPLMASACAELAQAIGAVNLKSPRLPVISNVDATAHFEPEELKSLLIKQVTEPVQWESSVRKLLAEGVETFYEIGPGKVLKGLLKRIDRKANCETVNDSVS